MSSYPQTCLRNYSCSILERREKLNLAKGEKIIVSFSDMKFKKNEWTKQNYSIGSAEPAQVYKVRVFGIF